MTAAAKLSEKAIDRRTADGSHQKTTEAPTQVEAPARQDSNNGNTQDDDDDDVASAVPSLPDSRTTSSDATVLATRKNCCSNITIAILVQ
mmetsp:Transcript_23212/g.54786  ORF Transcript_23212/g.54786 Transcript_23212/m.54786 type:complete len:90 (+) Transcript_23212:1664-1933(+)